MLTGSVPAYQTAPPSVSSAGREAVELAASAGLILDGWQAQILDVALGERADGRWAARECAVVCPRQNGKGALLEALSLFWLFLSGDKLVLHSAHQFKTSTEAFIRLRMLIESTPDLDRLVHRIHTANGNEGIELKNGNRLRFVARNIGSGRGFSADKIVVDEAFHLSDQMLSAMIPTMAARPNPQIWYVSSAPLPTVESSVLRRLCKRGRDGSDSLAYFEFAADSFADLDDRGAWAAANPGFPQRIDEEFIEFERSTFLPDDFARERLGIWVDPDVDGPQVIPADRWNAATSDDSDVSGQPFFALEVAEDRSWAAFGVAGKSTLGDFTHGAVVDYQSGVEWVASRAVELCARWGSQLAVAKNSPAWALIPQLERAGLRVAGPDGFGGEIVAVSMQDQAASSAVVFDLVMAGSFRHRNQPHLDVAVRGAARRAVGDMWVWSRRRSTVDISPLVAVTLAVGLAGRAVSSDLMAELW